MMGAAAETEKKRGIPLNIDFLHEFVHSSPEPGGEVRFDSTPPAAAQKAKGNASARFSPDSMDVYIVSPPSAPAKGKGKRRREDAGEFSDEGLRRDIAGMSDGELRREIQGIPTFGLLLTAEKKERNRRLLPLLQEEEARRRRLRTSAAKDGGECYRDARSGAEELSRFDTEDEKTEDDSRKYFQKPSTIRPTNKNYGSLGVQTRRSSSQTGLRKPIPVDKMYPSRTSPTSFCGHTRRVRANDPKEHDNAKSRHTYRDYAKRRNEHHEDSSLLQKVNEVVLLDDEDVQPDEPIDCVVPDEWKELKIYYPSSDDREAVELSSSDIRCLNPGRLLELATQGLQGPEWAEGVE